LSTSRPDARSGKLGRRWFQFSTRALLVWLFVFASGLGWVAYEREQTKKRQDAVNVISKARGWSSDNDETTGWLTQIRAFLGGDDDGPVIAVCLSKAKFGDAELAQLKVLNNLRWLEIDQTQVSDAGLVHLMGLSELHYLDVSGTQVTDVGVEKLQSALPNVTIIR
jgi:hypothetical protein